jgi:hypothetical protein
MRFIVMNVAFSVVLASFLLVWQGFAVWFGAVFMAVVWVGAMMLVVVKEAVRKVMVRTFMFIWHSLHWFLGIMMVDSIMVLTR